MPGDLIQTPQTLWKAGSYESAQRQSTLILTAIVANAPAETRYSVLRVPGSATGYQVPPNTTLFLTRAQAMSNVASAQWHMLTGTTDVGHNSIAAPATVVPVDTYLDGLANPFPLLSALVTYDISINHKISSGLYPYVRCLLSSGVQIWLLTGHLE